MRMHSSPAEIMCLLASSNSFLAVMVPSVEPQARLSVKLPARFGKAGYAKP